MSGPFGGARRVVSVFIIALMLVGLLASIPTVRSVEMTSPQSSPSPTHSSVPQTNVTSDSNMTEPFTLGALPEDIPDEARVTVYYAGALPTHFDWRQQNGYNWMTSVKNQGGCGSCVGFGAVGALEGQLKIQTNNPSWNVDLSEQHLFSCGGGKCSMGWYLSSALSYLQQYGTPDESCSPYQGRDVVCSTSCSDWQSRAYKIASWNWVTNEPAAIEAALQNGPLLARFDVYSDFISYFSSYPTGVYHRTSNTLAGGHAIAIVGYDSIERYWIVKNSWGANWGESGYFRIGFGEAGIEQWVASVRALSTNSVTFYTDPGGSGAIVADGVVRSDGTTASYPSGSRLHLIANPPDEYMFSNWEANSISVDSPSSADTYATVSANGWLKAHFTGQPEAGVSQGYVLGFKVSNVYSDSYLGEYYISSTGWLATDASFQVTLNAGESFFLMGSAQVWNDYANIGSSIAVCRDGVRISGDMFAAGATITSRELATAIAVDTPGAGTYTYSLCGKTDPGGRAALSQGYVLGFKVSNVYSSSYLGEDYVSTTGWSATDASFQVTLGAGESLFLIGSAQVWNDYANVGSSIAVCRDGARVSGDMFAAGATLTSRELAIAIAVDTPSAIAVDTLGTGTYTYSLSAKTD